MLIQRFGLRWSPVVLPTFFGPLEPVAQPHNNDTFLLTAARVAFQGIVNAVFDALFYFKFSECRRPDNTHRWPVFGKTRLDSFLCRSRMWFLRFWYGSEQTRRYRISPLAPAPSDDRCESW